MKGKTNDIDVVKSCQSFFYFSLQSDMYAKRNKKLDAAYMTCDITFVHQDHYFVTRLIMTLSLLYDGLYCIYCDCLFVNSFFLFAWLLSCFFDE